LTELVTTLKLNREDREENIFYGLRSYRFCQTMRWIPSLMRVTFQLIRKPTERPLSEIGPISTIEHGFFVADRKWIAVAESTIIREPLPYPSLDPTAQPLNELTYFFFAVFAVQNTKLNQRHLSIESDWLSYRKLCRSKVRDQKTVPGYTVPSENRGTPIFIANN
jgi:hypothetical protein